MSQEQKFCTIDLDQLNLNNATGVLIRVDGRINAGGGDNRLLARLNDDPANYRGFVVMAGDAGRSEEEEQRGLYLGRNDRGLDAHFSFTLIISLLAGRKRTAYAVSTFAHADDEKVSGYNFHGFWSDTETPIRSVSLWTAGPGRGVLEAHVVVGENQ